jgi:hypothetical protein
MKRVVLHELVAAGSVHLRLVGEQDREGHAPPFQPIMGMPDKDPTVTPSALLRCNDDSSEHANGERLIANADLTLINRQMGEYLRCLAKDQYGRRGAERAIVVSFVRSIIRPSAVQQFVDPLGGIIAEFIRRNIEQFHHRHTMRCAGVRSLPQTP